MPFTTFGRSDTGRQRASNEDTYVCLEGGHLSEGDQVVAVADGMGGHAGGQVASKIAVAALESSVALMGSQGPSSARSLLTGAYESANREILATAAEDVALADMGTTMVAAFLHGTVATLANLGDSRAYLARNGIIGQITVDHSWREEARRYDLPPEEVENSPFRETITRSLGVDPSVEVDLFDIDLEPGDRLVLCSDGVHDLLTDLEILAAIETERTPDKISLRLIDDANAAGGHDNCTCVLIQYEAADTRATEPVNVSSGAIGG